MESVHINVLSILTSISSVMKQYILTAIVAAVSSSLGIETALSGATLDLPMIMLTSVCSPSFILIYATAPYAVSEASEKMCSSVAVSCVSLSFPL